MGFIKKNHEIQDIGLVLPEAYAQIKFISIDIDGNANVVFAIQQNRDSIETKDDIDTIAFSCTIDKDLPIYKQVYEKAKSELFLEWEDDIV